MQEVMSKPDILEIVNLKMVPYGNTHVDAAGVYHCQHGVGECMSNVLMQCLLYKLSDDLGAISSGTCSFISSFHGELNFISASGLS
jgi:hypothetical protein